MSQILTKSEMKEDLQLYVCNVTFTKKDNTERVMKCTLRQDMISYSPSKTNKVKSTPETLVVYDIENKGFRSFSPKAVTWFSRCK